MKQFIYKYRQSISIFLFAALFILLVFPQLNLPYFWDELGVYSRSSLYLKDHGLSLMPGSCPPELSRGHPLLFSFIYGLSFIIFGDGVVTGHITSIVISFILLGSVYFTARNLLGKTAAGYSVLFLICQPLFIAQSALVLPEVMLALFMILSIFYWIKKKYFLFILFSTCAILTKETAVIIPASIIASEIWIAISKRKYEFRFIHLSVLFPLLVFTVFLFIQKRQNGWYLFPLHQQNIDFDLHRFLLFLRDYSIFIFTDQGRLFFILLLGIAFVNYFIIKKQPLNSTLRYLLVLIVAGLVFSSVNFYMERYTLFIIVSMSIVAGFLFAQFKSVVTNLLFLFGFILCLMSRNDDKFDYDSDLDYISYLKIQEEAVDFAVKNFDTGDSVFSNFPIVYSLTDSRLGFCDTTQIKFAKLKKNEIDGAEYFMIANPGSYDHNLPDDLVTVKEFTNGSGSMRILEKGNRFATRTF